MSATLSSAVAFFVYPAGFSLIALVAGIVFFMFFCRCNRQTEEDRRKEIQAVIAAAQMQDTQKMAGKLNCISRNSI